MKQHKISWLNIPGYIPETWNPIIGCSKVSPGCDHCYAEVMANRIAGMKSFSIDDAIYQYRKVYKWNGETAFVESSLYRFYTWQKKPRAIFVCSMSDLFHENTPFEWIDKVMALAAISPKHIFIILTKRPERMANYFKIKKETLVQNWEDEIYSLGLADKDDDVDAPACWIYNRAEREWPLKNIWLGVTAENQEQADKRIPILLQISAVKRFVSCEPLLGPISFQKYWFCRNGSEYPFKMLSEEHRTKYIDLLNWVICGPENGPKARPMEKQWIIDIAHQCADADVPFFDKRDTLGLDLQEFPKIL